jgi:DNA replication and repair protein RecF
MRVVNIRLRDFRNYPELDLRPTSGLNLLVGENAQGKTNLLEAIHLLATTRSLKASREGEMIRHGGACAGVWAEVESETSGTALLEVEIYPGDRKSVRINGSRRERVTELLGQINVVFFGALDLGIVSGEPSLRRRYLNTEISQTSPKYCFDLANYRKVLEQRNRLLRDLRERPIRNSGLEAWDEQLAAYGAMLVDKRRFYIERLAPLAEDVHRELTDGRETLTVRYLPNLPIGDARTPEAVADLFRAELARMRPEEIRRGTSLVGPQRDDLQFCIGGVDARPFGSQGQQRTVVLSLKLAEFRLMEALLGEPPVLLLDDVMSDLDDARRAHLLRWIDRKCQTFVTCTSLESFPRAILEGAQVYRVAQGTVEADAAQAPKKARHARASASGAEKRGDGPASSVA